MKHLIAILLFASTALAQNNSGTLVIAPIRPQASNDTFPSAIANEIQGGPFSVATTAAMSNIPTTRLVPGAVAYVTNDSLFRMWDGSAWGASNLRTAIGLGRNDSVTFGDNITLGTEIIGSSATMRYTNATVGLQFFVTGQERGAFNTSGLKVEGNAVINQSVTNDGLLFIYRTNSEPFLGLANLIASNNTTISNETLFRVGVAEATNKSAQFGFRSTNTNGTGVAVFSVFGYNALAMIGPSARSATNTNGIEADIYSISPTNKVATLIDTNTGATLMHRPVGFNTNASAPANTTNVVGWIQFYVGTNSVRVPYYQ